MGVFDFLSRKSANNDLQAVLTPEKQENLLSQFLPDDPDKRSQIARALIMGGASAMAAGGPSVGKPTNLLSVLGSGLAGGVKGYSDAEIADNDLAKTRSANATNQFKMQQIGDGQARAKAFFAKHGSPTQAGYGPEALAELMQLQLLNGDEEGARASQAQLQKLQLHAADNGMVIDPNSGGFKLAPGYGESLFDTQKAKSLGDSVGENEKFTADRKNYLFGKTDPGFIDYQTEQKKAGVANPDNEFQKKSNQLAAERYQTMSQQGAEAQTMVGNIQNLSELGKTIGTGRWAQVKKSWGPWAESFGVKVDGLDEAQAYESLKNRIAPTLRAPGSGSSSDTDVNMFMSSLPSLGNTPEGNALIADTIKSVQDVKTAAGNIANRVNSGEISWQEGDKLVAELPNPYERFKEYRKSGGITSSTDKPTKSPSSDSDKPAAAPKTGRVAVVTSEAEYNTLPSGSPYRFSDEETVRTKP
jgi:hypothetical protein